jgi:type II secretory pathway pseudopilin PulG
MSPVAIIAIVILALLVLLFVGGLIGARRRTDANADRLQARIAAADRALEAARAADRGWDPILLEEAARVALERERPDFRYDKLHLVLVDDRPGTDEDRAEMAAVSDDEIVRVGVTRRGDSWVAESVR